MTAYTLRQLRLLVTTELDAIANLTRLEDPAGSVPVDDLGRARAYCVLYTGSGHDQAAEEALCGGAGPFDWRFQVTCAGGTVDRAEWALTRVRGALLGRRLTPDSGLVREDFTPEFVVQDTTASPIRWYFPAIYTITLP